MAASHKRFFLARSLALFSLFFALTSCSFDESPQALNHESLVETAQQLHRQGDDAGAADLYARLLTLSPDDNASRTALASILETHGQYTEAAHQYGQALAIDPDNADLFCDRGRVFIKLGKDEEARNDYEKALAQDPEDTHALNGLGIALDYLGQHSAAQNLYQRALNQDSHDLVSLNNLAHSFILSGGYSEAIHLLEPYVTDPKTPVTLRQNLVEAYALSGMDLDAARVARLDMSEADVKKNLAFYHEQRQKQGLVPKYRADLGIFGTEALAHSHAESIQTTFPHETEGLVMEIVPVLYSSGDIPHFDLGFLGFSQEPKLHDFCQKLHKSGFKCTTSTPSASSR